MVERDTLNLRLSQIENLRDQRGDWISAVHNVIRLFPVEVQKKITAFRARKQRENAKNLLTSLEKVRAELLKLLNASGENVKKGEEIMFETQRFGQVKSLITQIDPYVAGLDMDTAGDLLDYEWKMLEQMEE